MTRYCILGGNGVFGVHMAMYLLRHVPDAHVICVGRNVEKPPAFSLQRGIDDARYEYHQIHVGYEPERIDDLFGAKRPEVIVNIAAQGEGAASFRHSWRFFDTNCVALARMVEPLIGASWLRKWVQVGSSEIYGSVDRPATEENPVWPSTPYSVSKAAADLHLVSVARHRQFPMNIVRPTNCYGPGQQLHRIIPKAALCAFLGRKLPLQGGGVARKSYLHFQDLAHAMYLITQRAPLGEIYNVGPPESTAIRTLVEMICKKAGVPFEQAVELAPERLGQDAQYLLDSAKIRQELGWEPKIDLSLGLDETVAWVRQHLDYLKTLPTDYVLRA